MLDEKYIDRMSHAIGLDNKEPVKGVYKAYRNYAYYYEPVELWETLVKDGYAYAEYNNKEVTYHVTKLGMQEIANSKNLSIRYTIEVEPKK